MTDVSYVPGGQTAIIGDRCWLLIDAAPDSAATREIWQRIREDASLDTLMASLLRAGFADVPSFALLAAEEGRRHLICRGRGSATLVTGGPAERVDGAGLATWREHPVAADVASVVLGDPPAGTDLQLPASAGIFLAQSVTVGRPATASGLGTAAAPFPPEPAVPESGVFAPEPAVPESGVFAPEPAVPETGGSEAGSPGAGQLPPAADARDGSATLSYSTADDCLPAAAGAGGGPAEDTGYDFLFAATQARTVEGAAVRPADDDVDDGPSLFPPGPAWEPPPLAPGPPSSLAPGPPSSLAPAPPSSLAPDTLSQAGPVPAALGGQAGTVTAAGQPGPGGLIESVPWVSGAGGGPPASPPAFPGQPAPARLDPGEDPEAASGVTVRRSDVRRLTAEPVLPDRIGPTVHALLCPSSHANPPNSTACRVCGLPLPQQDPVTVPRPVLGVLRLSTGDVITLDRGVVMGRSPRTDFDGEERPHVVKLPSGDGEISRTHLQVSLDGWHVLVTDLKSTNGTLVALPGRDPERLRPHEPSPIQPGTIVTLADGINFRYEVTP